MYSLRDYPLQNARVSSADGHQPSVIVQEADSRHVAAVTSISVIQRLKF